MSKTWILALAVVGLIGVGIAWGFISHKPPEWHELQELHHEIRASVQSSDDRKKSADLNGTDKESEEAKEQRESLRQEQFAKYREKLQALPEALQKKARQQMGDLFVSRMQEKIDLVLSLPPEERDAELDKQIDEWDRRRASWEKRREQQNANAEQTTNAEGNKQGAGASSEKKSGRRRGWWTNARKEQRATWRRDLLSRTPPEQRAKWHEYRRLMNDRRKERGLTSW